MSIKIFEYCIDVDLLSAICSNRQYSDTEISYTTYVNYFIYLSVLYLIPVPQLNTIKKERESAIVRAETTRSTKRKIAMIKTRNMIEGRMLSKTHVTMIIPERGRIAVLPVIEILHQNTEGNPKSLK